MPGPVQIPLDSTDIVAPVRGAREKAGRVVRKQCSDSMMDQQTEFVVFEPVPNGKNKLAAGPQHSSGLAIAGNPIGKKHHAELADDNIE